MGKICDFKNKIIDAVVECYSDVNNVNGEDLEELGEWIDICKDIEEMRYYEYMAIKTKAVIDAMKDENDNRTLDSVIQSLENIITEGISDMTQEEINSHKEKLKQIIAEM